MYIKKYTIYIIYVYKEPSHDQLIVIILSINS